MTIENDILSYRGVFKRSDISLKEVASIAVRIETSTDSDQNTSSKRVVYVLDELGRAYFSFPGSLITRKNEERFINTVTAINPDIKFF